MNATLEDARFPYSNAVFANCSEALTSIQPHLEILYYFSMRFAGIPSGLPNAW